MEVLAFHIIAEQECLRKLGSKKKTRKFKGVVIQLYLLKKTGTKQGTTYVEANYDLETSEKRKKNK